MKSAGIALINGRVVIAVIINFTAHVYRVKDANEAKDILDTAKPDVVGMDISAAAIYDDIRYAFNVVKVERGGDEKLREVLDKLTFLNITKEEEKPAILAACHASESVKS